VEGWKSGSYELRLSIGARVFLVRAEGIYFAEGGGSG